MKLTRRQLIVATVVPAITAVPAVAAAQTTAQDNLKRNAETLAKLNVPMSIEPAFQFKA
jgi:hypothetical protein